MFLSGRAVAALDWAAGGNPDFCRPVCDVPSEQYVNPHTVQEGETLFCKADRCTTYHSTDGWINCDQETTVPFVGTGYSYATQTECGEAPTPTPDPNACASSVGNPGPTYSSDVYSGSYVCAGGCEYTPTVTGGQFGTFTWGLGGTANPTTTMFETVGTGNSCTAETGAEPDDPKPYDPTNGDNGDTNRCHTYSSGVEVCQTAPNCVTVDGVERCFDDQTADPDETPTPNDVTVQDDAAPIGEGYANLGEGSFAGAGGNEGGFAVVGPYGGTINNTGGGGDGNCDLSDPGCVGAFGGGGGNVYPSWGDAPTFTETMQSFQTRLGSSPVVESVKNFSQSVPAGGSCPIGTFSAFGQAFTIDFHCTNIGQFASIISVAFLAVWAIAAFRIFASA